MFDHERVSIDENTLTPALSQRERGKR